ncbi:YciI family protein [Enterovirga aerilata]|uniref:YciI family protein n=1 Tax=Enterovirga aerilata TaxID=2730920 RepID=UPI003211D20A
MPDEAGPEPARLLFAVMRERGSGWDASSPADRQPHWEAHLAFLRELAGHGALQAAGPFDDGLDVMLLVWAATREEAEARLAADPWTVHGLLRTTRIARWRVAVGTVP